MWISTSLSGGTSTLLIKESAERSWCCQSTGDGIVAGLSQTKSGRPYSLPQVVDPIGAPGIIRTCDPLIRSQVLYPTELRVRSANTKGCAAICKMPVSTREIARLRARGEVGIGDFDLDFVPLAARALALRLVRDRVKRSEIGRNLAIKLGHVLQLVNLVQVTASAISQRL